MAAVVGAGCVGRREGEVAAGAVGDTGAESGRRRRQRRRHVAVVVVVGGVRSEESVDRGRGLRLRVGGGVRATARADTLLDAQRRVGFVRRGALERLDETLAEVLAEEGVEERVEDAVGVAHDGDHLEEVDHPVGHRVGGERETHLEHPVGHPAHDVGGDHRQHHLSDFAVRALLHLRLRLRPDGLQPDEHQRVKDADERDGDGEAEQERVPDERLVGGDQLPVRPADGARATAAGSVDRLRVQDDGQHGEQGHGPDDGADDARHDRRAVSHRADRVADGQVAVGAHHRQREDRREPVDRRLHVEHLAHRVAEHPRAQQHRRDEERQADEEAQVGDG